MKQLIINADDFALSDGVCAGIAESIQQGVVTSTTAMVCVAGAEQRLKRWQLALPGKIGLHLQLTGGTPCLEPAQVPSLIGSDGMFPRSKSRMQEPDTQEVLREWRAQIERLRALGIEPTHLDSHHHVHLEPGVLQAFISLAREYGLPVRTRSAWLTRQLRAQGITCPDQGITRWFGEPLTEESLLAVIDEAFGSGNAQTLELMCHPGHVDALLADSSRYVGEREQELKVLCSPYLRGRLLERSITLVSMSALRDRQRKPGAA